MMETLTIEQVRELSVPREGLCLSIYTPTERVIAGNDIRFKNMVRQAEKLLAEAGQSERQIKAFLEPAWHLYEDSPFWSHQSDGLAAFIGADLFRFYRVPMPVPELVTLNQRFYLRPLLELVQPGGYFYVLALSKGQARVLYCTRYSCRRLEVPDLPESLAYTLRFDETERQRLAAEHQPGSGREAGGSQVGFHGHGTRDDRNIEDFVRYCHEIDHALYRVLGAGQAPLVIAAVQEDAALFRRANKYAHLTEAIIPGNSEEVSDDKLHGQAWPIVEASFQARRQQDAARLIDNAALGQGSTDPREIALAAHDGLIDTLFTAVGRQQWGKVNPETRQVAVHDTQQAGDDDLLDAISQQVLATGGVVWAVPPAEMPAPTLAAASYRYPVAIMVVPE